MSGEIFGTGPLLPIVIAVYRHACEIMQKMEHLLGLQIFSTDKREIDDSRQHIFPPFLVFQSSEPSPMELTSISPLQALARRCDSQRCEFLPTQLS